MASPVAHLNSIIQQARELLNYAEAGGDREHAFNLVVDSKALQEADSALDSMLEACEDEFGQLKAKKTKKETVEPVETPLSLIKEVTNKDEPKNAKELVKALNAQLSGKKVAAFGGKAGLYGTSKKPVNYKISKVVSSYNDGKDFVSLDVVLDKYNINRDHRMKDEEGGLIYTDPTFLKSLKDLVQSVPAGKHVKEIRYSEHGMQGPNYVNLDVTVKI